MFGNNEYIGISAEGNLLKIARVVKSKNRLKLLRVDKLKLIKPLKREEKKVEEIAISDEDLFDDDIDDDSESIFGLSDDEEDDLAEIDLTDISDEKDLQDMEDLDLVKEASTPDSNEMLVYNYLSDLGSQKKHITLNIPSGTSIFQFIKGSEFSKRKKKELEADLEEKISAIYGEFTGKDQYDYHIIEDNMLLLVSIDEDPRSLGLLREVRDIYKHNIHFSNVIPDEIISLNLFRSNYESDNGEITGLLQLGPNKCRLEFVQNNNLIQVSPVINEGTEDKTFLNTIFSKILFQLDTGEISGLDRLIVINNSVGNKVTNFLSKNFPDVTVENFTFRDEKLEIEPALEEASIGYTTAIGLAVSGSKSFNKDYLPIGFLPSYVDDEQKIFKLHWHGFLLLLMIGASPVILNYFYQQNVAELERLESQINRIDMSIIDVEPLVLEAEDISARLNQMQQQLSLLSELSQNSVKWTFTMNYFNSVVEETGNIWVNSFRQEGERINIDGYALSRDRIPQLANKFDSVTLLNVRGEEIRDRDVFYFTMSIQAVVDDPSSFTPASAVEIQRIIDQ